MTYSPADVAQIVEQIPGFLYPAEAAHLYALACEIPQGGRVVELGCYRGKSTTAMLFGVREREGVLCTVDPFEGVMVGDIELHNYYTREVQDVACNLQLDKYLRIVVGYSHEVVLDVDTEEFPIRTPIDLLFIDAEHSYESVSRDLADWSPLMTDNGRIALHDHNANWPGVQLAVAEFVARAGWRIVSQVEGLVTLERNSA
jgi:predicted O-methyltransferase YrrM